MYSSPRGFTLLVAIVFSSVVLSLALALLDIAYKQLVLSSTEKQSQIAFYIADSAIECTLYYDQKLNAFGFASPLDSSELLCKGLEVQNYDTQVVSDGISGLDARITSFSISCESGPGTEAQVIIYKASNAKTAIYASGYSSCNAGDPRRLERGLRVLY